MNMDTDAAKKRLMDDFRGIMRVAEDLLTATRGQAGERIEAARARAEDTLRDARRKIDDLEEDLGERTRNAARATDRAMHDNPWQAVMIAAGIGLVLGLLASRRNSHD